MSLWSFPFPLSTGQIAELHLPPELTRIDAERLKQFIDAIVQDDQDKETADGR